MAQVISTNISSLNAQRNLNRSQSATANLTETRILQQAGTAMPAQANQLPQEVLSLLR